MVYKGVPAQLWNEVLFSLLVIKPEPLWLISHMTHDRQTGMVKMAQRLCFRHAKNIPKFSLKVLFYIDYQGALYTNEKKRKGASEDISLVLTK